MYPITSYPITPDLFGRVRWQAEIDGQRSRFARRSYRREKAEWLISHDESALWDGRVTFAQRVTLPLLAPLRRKYDRICSDAQQRRKAKLLKKNPRARQ